MNIKSVKLFIMSVLTASLLFSQTAFSKELAEPSGETENGGYLESMMKMINEEYKGDITDEKLMEGALKGMFATMDPYTEFYTPDEAESFFNSINGSYEGIGLTIDKENNNVVVKGVFPGSPAERAGIAVEDRIAEIDGKSVGEMTVEDVSGIMKGAEGTKVTLGIVAADGTEIRKLEIKREKITVNPVSYKINGDIGYIRIDIFNMNMDEYLTKALAEIDKKNIKEIILDLRDNPGGEASQAVEAARKFVPEGLITKLDFKSENKADVEYYSYLKEKKYEVAVLVNNNSASASEILAGAIQDTGSGTLVGTRTFGKAKVQSLIPLLTPKTYEKYKSQLGIDVVDAAEMGSKYNIIPKDDELIGWTKITTGIYTTPKGRMIDTVGIAPDIYVENTKEINDVKLDSVKKLGKKLKPALNSKDPEVEDAEKILKICGYDVGTPDNEFDNKTFEAVKKFQKDKGMFPYGVLDFTTQQALNEGLDKLLSEADKQYLKAVEILQE